MAISSPLQSKVPVGSSKTIRKLQTILLNRTKVKREIFQKQTILQNRRIENERRKQREDELEAPNLVTKPRGAAGLIAGSAKGFFERLVGFLSYLTAGWIINNLPTWISMGKEFIARTQQMGKILGGFITNSTDIFKNFTKLLGAGLTNLMKFDFLDTSGRVSTAFDELNLSVENWGTDFENVIKLITTPLTEGIASGEDARPLGTENTNEGAYERTAPYSGSGGSAGGKLLPIHKQALDIISGPESGGSYNAMNQGTINDDIVGSTLDSKTKIKKNLTDMTIGEVLQRQKWLMNKSNPQISDYGVYAAGRYQFIPIQLPVSMKSAGLSPGDKFSPENQDLMAAALMQDRGIQPWTVGGSKYSKQELAIVEKARKTPFGSSSSTSPPQQSTPTQIVQVPPGKINPIVGDRLGAGRNHGGTDLAVNNGTPLRAVSDGVIVDSDYENGWGNFLVMKDDRGIYHLYGHMQSGYKRSGPVKRGEVIGKVGMTGRTSGPHLHWEAGTGWNGGVITGRFDPLNKYSKFAPFNTSYSESKPPTPTRQQSPTPAQISSTGTPQNPQISQSLAPERTGPTVIVSQNPSSPARQMMSSGGGGSSGGGSSQISEFTLLNNFIKNKLLLDLAYL